MNEILLIDDMKKESKVWLFPMILFFLLSILCPIIVKFVYQGNGFSDRDLIFAALIFILIASYFLYGYLYAIKYKVTVTTDKIILKTLFKNLQLNISDIKNYLFKRYKKSVFYQFTIFYLDQKILINTRYYGELDKILKEMQQR